MKKLTLKVLGVLALVTMVLVACNKSEEFGPQIEDLVRVDQLAPVASYSSNAIPGQYIVVYKRDGSKAFANQSYEATQIAMKKNASDMMLSIKADPTSIGHVYGNSIVGFSAKLSEAQLERLRTKPEIDYIEQDQEISLIINAPPPGKGPGNGGGDGGGGTDPTQETPWGIDRVGGSVDVTIPGNEVGTAWIIDTGIDLNHPDLAVDASRGFSAFTKGKDAGFDDGHGHGTHVAGTIAAKDNSIGVVGVAAGATVVPVKVLNSRGSGSTSGVIAGVDYVGGSKTEIGPGASTGDVANMSLGGGVSPSLDAAVEAASGTCKFALAAGNESDNANNHSPARANGSNIYTIASMTSSGNWSSFSNYGFNDNPVDYIAPGSSIKSTWKGGGYNTISGTSMASPHAAGVLLLGNPQNGGSVTGPDGIYTVISH